MATEITTIASFNNIRGIDFGDKVIFYKFGGPWCKPCKELTKNMECIADIITYDINVENEEFQEFLVDHNVCSIPDTIVKYKNNELRFQGLKSTEEILSIINTLKAFTT